MTCRRLDPLLTKLEPVFRPSSCLGLLPQPLYSSKKNCSNKEESVSTNKICTCWCIPETSSSFLNVLRLITEFWSQKLVFSFFISEPAKVPTQPDGL